MVTFIGDHYIIKVNDVLSVVFFILKKCYMYLKSKLILECWFFLDLNSFLVFLFNNILHAVNYLLPWSSNIVKGGFLLLYVIQGYSLVDFTKNETYKYIIQL